MNPDTPPRVDRTFQNAAEPIDQAMGARSASSLAKLFAGHIGSKVMGLLAFAWLSRVLTPAEYGLVETVVGMSLIGFMCVEFSTGTIGVRTIARGDASSSDTIRAVVSARLVASFVCVPVLVLVYAGLLGQQAPVVLILLFGVSLIAVVVRHDWLFMARGRMGIAAAGVTLKMVAFFAFVVLLPPSSYGIVAVGWAECGAMAAMALYFILAAPLAGARIWQTPDFAKGIRMVRESASLGISGLVNTAAAALPILIVTILANAKEGGELGAAQRIIISLTAFSILYYQALLPLFVSHMQRATQDAAGILSASDQVVAWAGVTASAFLFLTAEPIMLAIYGEKLAGSSVEFSIVVLSMPLTLAYGSARLALIGQDRQNDVLKAQLLAAATTLVAAGVLAPWFGGEGAAAGILLGHAALWVITLWFNRTCPIRSNWTVYGAPVTIGLAVLSAGHALALNAWLEAILGFSVIALVAILSPKLRKAAHLLIAVKQN